VKKDMDAGLRTLRDNDFENTSVITYKLVTNKRNMKTGARDNEYFLGLLKEFLLENNDKQVYNQLVFIAPESVLQKLQHALPESVKNKIKATISEDYLNVPQDKLEEYVSEIFQN